MIRVYAFHFSEILELVFLEPLRFAEEIHTNPLSPQLVSGILTFLASLSLAVGFVFISPPYGTGYLFRILANTGLHFLLLYFFAIVFGAVFDGYAQKLARKGKAGDISLYARLSLAILSLFAPLSILLTAAGIVGASGFFLILVLVIGFYLAILVRGARYLYEIKERDAILICLKSFGIAFVFPFVLYLYLSINFIMALGMGS